LREFTDFIRKYSMRRKHNDEQKDTLESFIDEILNHNPINVDVTRVFMNSRNHGVTPFFSLTKNRGGHRCILWHVSTILKPYLYSSKPRPILTTAANEGPPERTALMFAIASNVTTDKTIKFLIDNRANVNLIPDANLVTLCIEERKYKFMKLLLDHGAIPSLLQRSGTGCSDMGPDVDCVYTVCFHCDTKAILMLF
jgi:hypothetical protein